MTLGERSGSPPREQTLAALERCHLLDGLSQEQVHKIAARCSVHHVPAQRTVFEEGDESRGLWVITAGRVRLQHLMADGRQHAVGFRTPTTALDLAAALDGRPYMETAAAVEESELLLVPRDLLPELARRYPVTIRNAIASLCIDVRQRDITTAIAAVKDARERVGCTLLQLVREFGRTTGRGVRIDCRVTRQDIAARAGVTVETAIRTMSELQQRGVVCTEAQIVEITDVAAVRELARCGSCQFECSVFAPAARAGAPQAARVSRR
ncbi:MAG: Crp/Fnr family transcriptional regulator [Dehalococcoidia bacterium]|nr:Crp/Fnr family transcriptional regulator [Dehalococcoidia bacterium]